MTRWEEMIRNYVEGYNQFDVDHRSRSALSRDCVWEQ